MRFMETIQIVEGVRDYFKCFNSIHSISKDDRLI
jgi:hypothetical protein